MKGQAEISSRLLPFILMMLPGWGALPTRRIGAVALVLFIVIGSGRFHKEVGEHFREYEAEEMGDLRGMFSLLDENDRLAYLRPDRKHRNLKRGASWYLDSYHMVLNGGLNRMPFHVIYPHHTVIFPQVAPPRVHEVKIHHFPGSDRARWYTHVLVFSKDKPNFRGREKKRLSLMAHTGSLWLYQLKHLEKKKPDLNNRSWKKTRREVGPTSLRSGSRFLDRLVRVAKARILREERKAKRKEALEKRKEKNRKKRKKQKKKKKKKSTKRKASTRSLEKLPTETDRNDR
jgi:hypothetical protein